MKLKLAALTAAAAVIAVPALAQEGPPPYDNGPVWEYTAVTLKDGHQGEYMRWLATAWKAQEETLKHAGIIVDYKVLRVVDARHDEPDLYLGQEYANMAAFDREPDQMYAFASAHLGSPAKANQEEAERSSMRTVGGEMLMREVRLK